MVVWWWCGVVWWCGGVVVVVVAWWWRGGGGISSLPTDGPHFFLTSDKNGKSAIPLVRYWLSLWRTVSVMMDKAGVV